MLCYAATAGDPIFARHAAPGGGERGPARLSRAGPARVDRKQQRSNDPMRVRERA